MGYLLILINAERFNVTKDSADAIANATTSVVEVTLTGKEMLRMWIPSDIHCVRAEEEQRRSCCRIGLAEHAGLT